LPKRILWFPPEFTVLKKVFSRLYYLASALPTLVVIDQEQYLTTVLDRFGITAEKHKAKKIPTADCESLRPADDKDERINVSEFKQGIGSLLYAMVFTRPDIAFVLGKS
jgi:hypothetical protein